MSINTNYDREMQNIIADISEKREAEPLRLLLHSCCAPCSSYVLEELSTCFNITIFFYNPNIEPRDEYDKRLYWQNELIHRASYKNKVELIEAEYLPEQFYNAVKGFEHLPENSERCLKCYELRLSETARLAKERDYDYFTTTLSVSPHKDARALNEICRKLSNHYSISSLPADFKKRGGYARSIELSKKYGLYRQSYCGCGKFL
ncbi:MAG: epoxyqueuosine reductase QueH [Oscillospiraceae bacterium]|nr:epoxyqueuosine reductase QueH [Oscillospiraceae bacterium]